jgi:uncharacterized membrane protein
MVIRFILYGFLGWILEIIFTGSGSLLRGSISLTGYTYLWMFPIYGLAVFLEPIHDGIRKAPWPIRGLIWAALILVIEYLSGWILIQLIGFCPWDYTATHCPSIITSFQACISQLLPVSAWPYTTLVGSWAARARAANRKA